MGMRLAWIPTALLVLVCSLILLLPLGVSAHAGVVATDPVDGARLPASPPSVEISTWSRSYTLSRMSWIERLMLSGVMPLAVLYSVCFSRRRLVSAIARSIEPVTVSA